MAQLNSITPRIVGDNLGLGYIKDVPNHIINDFHPGLAKDVLNLGTVDSKHTKDCWRRLRPLLC